MKQFDFTQVNVFSSDPLGGNPVAVVNHADGLSDTEMAALARWTNLSETTFILKPDQEQADYKLRIFTPSGELSFAGHPTLGSCHVWLKGLEQRNIASPKHIVQQCGVGLVNIENTGAFLELEAPPLINTGALDSMMLSQVCSVLNISRNDILYHQYIDNGPGWIGVVLKTAQEVLALQPTWSDIGQLFLGVAGFYNKNNDAEIEVRAFVGPGQYEDPVTGSLNAGFAQWLMAEKRVPDKYVASQGTILQRSGRVHLRKYNDGVWVGGVTTSIVEGKIHL